MQSISKGEGTITIRETGRKEDAVKYFSLLDSQARFDHICYSKATQLLQMKSKDGFNLSPPYIQY